MGEEENHAFLFDDPVLAFNNILELLKSKAQGESSSSKKQKQKAKRKLIHDAVAIEKEQEGEDDEARAKAVEEEDPNLSRGGGNEPEVAPSSTSTVASMIIDGNEVDGTDGLVNKIKEHKIQLRISRSHLLESSSTASASSSSSAQRALFVPDFDLNLSQTEEFADMDCEEKTETT